MEGVQASSGASSGALTCAWGDGGLSGMGMGSCRGIGMSMGTAWDGNIEGREAGHGRGAGMGRRSCNGARGMGHIGT